MNLTPENNNFYKYFKKYYYVVFLIFPFMAFILDLLEFKMPKEAYSYTFSTIAQTLAALIAFIGMFVIFKLDKIKTETKRSLDDIESIHANELMPNKHRYHVPTECAELCNIEYNNLNEFVDNISKVLLKIKNLNQDYVPHELRPTITKLNHHINSIEINKKLGSSLRQKYDTSLTFGFVAITLSIIFLSFGRIYHPDINFNIPPLEMIVLGFTIYATSVSIVGSLLVLEESLELNDDGNYHF